MSHLGKRKRADGDEEEVTPEGRPRKKIVLKYATPSTQVLKPRTQQPDTISFITLSYRKADAAPSAVALPRLLQRDDRALGKRKRQVEDEIAALFPAKRTLRLKFKPDLYNRYSFNVPEASKSRTPAATAEGGNPVTADEHHSRSKVHGPLHSCTATLEDLPTELLEMITWQSLNPFLPLTSKTIFSKLGHQRKMRSDMVMVVFCEWAPASTNDSASHRAALDAQSSDTADEDENVLCDLSLLPLRHPLSKCVTPFLTSMDRHDLREQYGEAKWCTIDLLKSCAGPVVAAWLNHNFEDSHFEGDNLRKYRLLKHDTANHPLNGALILRDRVHLIRVSRLYQLSVLCASKGSSTSVQNNDFCPGRCGAGRRQAQFALPKTPRHVVLAPNDDIKESALLFYQNKHVRSWIEVNSGWDKELCYHRHIKEEISKAFADGREDIGELLLRQDCRSCAGGWCDDQEDAMTTSGQWLIALLACANQFGVVRALANSLTGPYVHRRRRDRRRPKPGLVLVDEQLRDLVVALANAADDDSQNLSALHLMKWALLRREDTANDTENGMEDPPHAELLDELVDDSGEGILEAELTHTLGSRSKLDRQQPSKHSFERDLSPSSGISRINERKAREEARQRAEAFEMMNKYVLAEASKKTFNKMERLYTLQREYKEYKDWLGVEKLLNGEMLFDD